MDRNLSQFGRSVGRVPPHRLSKLNPVKQSLEPTINPKNGEFIKKLRYVDNELSNNKEYATDPTPERRPGRRIVSSRMVGYCPV